MKGLIISLLLVVTFTDSLVSSAAPEGYEYGWANFGEAEPNTLQPKVNLASGDQFGRVVVIGDGLAAVSSNAMAVDSSSGQAGFQGKVFLFHRNYLLQWVDSEQYFTSGSQNDGFGTSLALYNNLLVVGAPTDSSTGANRGMVYIYTGNLFGTVTTIVATEHVEDNDYFGHSVAVTHGFTDYYGEGTIVVGAYGHNKDKEHEEAGCVLIFAQLSSGVWSQVGVIEPSFPVNHGGFGYSVASYGNALVVGSYGSDHAHVFELHGFIHECPHEDHEHHNEDMPAECQDEEYTETDTDDTETEEERRRRALQGGGPPDENKKYYTEWKYTESLMIGFNVKEGHAPEDKSSIQHFGASVGIYNQSGILTVAVGCPECVTDNGVEVGAVYVFSKLAKGHAAVGWLPDDYHPREEGKEGKRLLQEKDEEEEEQRKHLWDPYEHDSHASEDGEYWFTENSFWGRIQYEHFGWSICVDASSLLVGSNPTTYLQGRAEVYSRKNINQGSPDYVQGGPLFNTAWRWASNLQDKSGITGDKYGYSVALYGGTAIVGSILSGLQEDGSFGSGAAYVYQRTYLQSKPNTQAPVVDEGNDDQNLLFEKIGDTNTFLGMSFVMITSVIGFCFMMALFYGMYMVAGGEKSPKRLVLDTVGFEQSSAKKSSRPLHLSSAMDDSGSSAGGSTRGFAPSGRGNMSAYSGLNTSSSHGGSSSSAPSSKFTPRQQYVPKGPPKPSYSPANKGRGRGLDDL